MRPRTVLIVGLALIGGTDLLLRFGGSGCILTNESRVWSDLKAGFISFRLLAEDAESNPYFREASMGLGTWEEVMTRLAPSDATKGVFPHQMAVDRWGHPYRVAWQKSNEAEIAAGYDRIRFFLWSSGKNGINEFGGGDDIALPPSREER